MKNPKKRLKKAGEHELKRRSLAKAVSWRVVATLTTMALVFIFTGEIGIMLGVGALDVISKLIFYFVHERAWDLINWGRYKEISRKKQ